MLLLYDYSAKSAAESGYAAGHGQTLQPAITISLVVDILTPYKCLRKLLVSTYAASPTHRIHRVLCACAEKP